MHPLSGTSKLLRDLRSLRVVVFHPSDHDGEEIIRQLQRIGCQVKAFWPPLEKLPDDIDFIFLAVRPEAIGQDFAWLNSAQTPPLIAVVNYENPTIVEAVIKVDAHGVLASPVKSFGLLTSMVIARQLAAKEREQGKQIGSSELLDGTRALKQARVAHSQHFSNRHAGSPRVRLCAALYPSPARASRPCRPSRCPPGSRRGRPHD